MPSIRQNDSSDLLPDFRNLAVIARVLVAVNAIALAGAIYAVPNVRGAIERFIEDAAFLEPLLFIEITVLFILSRQLGRLSYVAGCVAIVAIVAVLAAGYEAGVASLSRTTAMTFRGALFAAVLTAVLLGYFRLFVKAYSPRSPRRGCRRCSRASGRTSCSTASTPCLRSSAATPSAPSARSRIWPTCSAA
jgi:two-component system sensor histidine kinase AlgZ